MAKYTQNYAKNGRPGEYPGFFLSKCEQLRKKTHVYHQKAIGSVHCVL